VIITITVLSALFFIAFGLIFRSVNQSHLNEVCLRCGNNISSIVEGALYFSMLKNDRTSLENTLDIINTMPGIEDVNLYDRDGRLAYSSFGDDTLHHSNPNCLECHGSLDGLFPRTEKSYKIVSLDDECQMSNKVYDHRLMLIRAPILNEPSCHTAACHAHQESDDILGSIVMRIPLDELDSTVQASSRDFSVMALLITLFLALFLVLFTRRNIKAPLHDIIKASEAVAHGNTKMRLQVKQRQLYDIKLVSNAFNEMLDNLEQASSELTNWSNQLEYKVQKKSEEISAMQNELIHVERIASLGKLSSSVAHEINNPLSGILTYTKLVQKLLSKPEVDESAMESVLKHLEVIETETKRCGDIVKGLLDFSRKDQLGFKTAHMHQILQEAYLLMEHQMEISDIDFSTRFDAISDSIMCSENQIKQACIAILLNASEAISENGEVIMRTSNPDKSSITLDIWDNGVGIPEEDLPHIFEPFFSAKHKTAGTGLGLAVVHGIVQTHNGKITVESTLDKGTTISISLPLQPR